MKSGFLVTGANCSGKTTSVAKALEKFEKDLRVCSYRADNDERFKGTVAEQEAELARIWESQIPVVVLEGTRINGPILRVAKQFLAQRNFKVFMTVQKPDVMLAHLRARCEKAGKTFRADYWTEPKLVYEGSKRYPNKIREANVSVSRYDIDLEYQNTGRLIGELEVAIHDAIEAWIAGGKQ